MNNIRIIKYIMKKNITYDLCSKQIMNLWISITQYKKVMNFKHTWRKIEKNIKKIIYLEM